MKLKRVNIIKIASFLCAVCFLLMPIRAGKIRAFDCFTIYALDKSYFIYPPEITYGLNGVKIVGLDNLCERIYLDTLLSPKDAELIFLAKGNNPFKIISEESGVAIPIESAKRQILCALLMGKTSVNLQSQRVAAKVDKGEVLKGCLLRGKYCTYFGNSSEGRKHNIALCVSKLNGAVINSGESFSFNVRVGKRCESAGYKSAKVIQNGEFTEGIGGGVCQVSTTLYNALLKSGLNVTEYHPHSLSVGYVAPSFDAMVSEVCDLRFENNTQGAVYIYAYSDDANLSICIYGLENEYEYKLTSNIVQKILPNPKILWLDETSDVKEIAPKEGIKSEGYISAYKNGELVFNRRIRRDSYKVVDGVIVQKRGSEEKGE